MRNFSFEFEKILSYKETMEDMKKNEYGMLKYKLNKAEDKLDYFYEYKNWLSGEKNNLVNKTNIGQLKLFNDYLNNINDNIYKQKEIIETIQNEVMEAKKNLVEATKEKKIYEKLKENKYNEFLYEQKKSEEKLVDNIVSHKITTQR